MPLGKKVSSDSLHNINLKIGVSFFVLLMVIILITMTAGSLLFKKSMTNTEDRLSKSITNVLALSVNRISFSGKYYAQLFTEKLLEKEKDLLYVVIYDKNGQLVAKSVDETLEGSIDADDFRKFLEKDISENDYFTRSRTSKTGEHVKEVIMGYQGSFDRAEQGIIAVGISTDEIENRLFHNNLLILIIGGTISLIGLVLVFIISRHLSAPVRRLAVMFQGILNHAPLSIVIRERDGKILETSSDFRSRFFRPGRKNESVKEFLSAEKILELENIDKEVFDGGTIVKKDLYFQNFGGDEDVYTSLTFKIEDFENDKETGETICTMALNVNDEIRTKEELLQKSEEARKASEAKGNFLATMSHEIRTPLTSVIGFLSLLKDTELTMPQFDYVKTALNSSENLLAIINDILDYSKIESKELKLDIIDINLRELISEISDVFSFQFKEKQLDFKVNVANDVFIHTKADPVRLRQILINLVGNAIKFTNEGEVTLDVTLEESAGKSFIQFSVTDTGIGMKEETIGKIFDRFSQADGSINRKFGGTGLGLSICRKLVDLMDGTINVRSVFGEGSTFIFSIPLENVQKVETVKEVVAENEDEGGYIGKRVLVADDEESNRKLIELFLSKLNLEIDYVEDGNQAYEKACHTDYDLILMDIQMPEMDGVQAVRLIRENEKLSGREKSTVVAFTANVFKEQLDKYFEEGFDDHFTKPFKKKELVNFIKKSLS